ncbi:RNA polymerase [Achromobacter phage vB_AxyP_19-32_Axy24]|uniref:DNA-directed RNA polymerase n=1 Tax=Achromobacter phage vB_AxyP_19-32_Axy24 TaxID=2591048 RepID=A0A514CW96_9CAUD|nr:RNA polymerase [Achromobacter phage vB_AxyP_19-32_Axy24]QDH84735.1 putative RNA polymerase [Achromobacter phage vB_AxyP_19-32_Axy24]
MQLFTAIENLKIDISNNFGNDKMDWLERIQWFDANESNLENLIAEADEPALFHAGVMAYRAVQRKEAIGYPVAFDATNSGMQILACLTGCRKTAELCNVVDVGRRVDGYMEIYGGMMSATGGQAKIDRKEVKSAVMTAFYGSEAIPKQVFGEGALLRVFEQTMGTMAPGAWQLNQFFLDIWNPEATAYHWVLPDNFHVHTKVMVKQGEIVHFLDKPYETFREVQGTKEKGRSLSANSVHSIDGMVVREMVRRCDYSDAKVKLLLSHITAIKMGAVICGQAPCTDKDSQLVETLWGHYKSTGFLSARIIDCLHLHNLHLVDMDVVLELLASLPPKPFKVLTVHDCFRCLPTYVNDLRKQYNLILAKIARSDLLTSILSQIMGRVFRVEKMEDLHDDILQTNYALS